MKTEKKHIIAGSLIFLGIFIALLPVILSNNYIRQDDLMWEIWPGMRMRDFGFLYYNTMFQLVRPLCMLSFYCTDLISIDIQNAVYVRLVGLIILGILGILLYFWQLLFNPNRLLAATFAISAFTLPAYQVFAATGNYSLILTALLLTFTGAFFWYKSFNTTDKQKKRRFLIWGSLFFFASLLDYPLSSMFVWALLVICYLNAQQMAEGYRRAITLHFFYFASFLTAGMMAFYYLFSRLVHVIFHVRLGERSAVLDTHGLFTRLTGIFNVFSWHADFWFWTTPHAFLTWPALSIIFLTTAALIIVYRQNAIYGLSRLLLRVMLTLSMLLLLFFLAYSPIMATAEVIITFRYAIVTMPILLYLTFWSFTVFSKRYRVQPLGSLLLIVITSFGIIYANLMTADGIVGPHQHDFAFIQKELTTKVIPLLKNNQPILIHAIACDEEPAHLGQNVPQGLEYTMRTCRFQQQVIGVIIHSLNKMGYPSNFKHHNKIVYTDKQIVVKDTPWGTLVVNSTSNADNDLSAYTQGKTVVTIDTRTMAPYNQFDLYKDLFKRVSKT